MTTLARTLPLIAFPLLAALATPAFAQDATLVPVASQATTQTLVQTTQDDAVPVCIEGMCLEVVSAPVLQLDPLEGDVTWMDEAPQLWRPEAPRQTEFLGFSSGSATDGGAAVIGRVEADQEGAAAPLLGTESAGMLTNVGDEDVVDGVTGLGFMSRF